MILSYICLPFLFSSRLLKPGKLAEYFLPSTGFDVITHFITYLTPTHTKYAAVSVVALTTLQQVVNDE